MTGRLLTFCRGAAIFAALTLVLPVTSTAAQTSTATSADLSGVKAYLADHVAQSKAGTEALVALAQQYYDLAAASGFDYEKLWTDHGPEVTDLLAKARQTWVEEASSNYEQSEGLVAGVPSLAYYDVWIDAGPSGKEDPVNALNVQVALPDGRVLDRPGSLYHSVTEPALWGTEDDAVGLRVDMDGDGALEIGEALPEANRLLGSAQALDGATGELATAVEGWDPTLPDAFTALVVMIPTMSGYFEEWKESAYVTGDTAEETRFVGVSRLSDIVGILSGLAVTYDGVRPALETVDPATAEQIAGELGDLVDFVKDLYAQEQRGTRFTAAQADQFGAELQTRATATAGQIAQAAALLGITIDEG